MNKEKLEKTIKETKINIESYRSKLKDNALCIGGLAMMLDDELDLLEGLESNLLKLEEEHE
jgi:hypothetical protein